MAGNRIADALATLATKMGASVVSTGNRVADNIDAIATKYDPSSGGGSGILSVLGSATAPEGKSGEMKKGDPKAPTEPLYYIHSSYAVIHAALEAGTPVFVYWEREDSASLHDIIHMGMVSSAKIEEDEGTWYKVTVTVFGASVTQNYYSSTAVGYLSMYGDT